MPRELAKRKQKQSIDDLNIFITSPPLAENSEWGVEYSKQVLNWMKKKTTTEEQKMKLQQIVGRLSSGERSVSLSKRVVSKQRIYEAKLSKAMRLLWTKTVTRHSTLIINSHKTILSTVYTDSIYLCGVVTNHDHIHTAVEHTTKLAKSDIFVEQKKLTKLTDVVNEVVGCKPNIAKRQKWPCLWIETGSVKCVEMIKRCFFACKKKKQSNSIDDKNTGSIIKSTISCTFSDSEVSSSSYYTKKISVNHMPEDKLKSPNNTDKRY